MAIINQNPEWALIETWFAKRAAEAGVSVYEHTEVVSVSLAIDPEIANVAFDLSSSFGRFISKSLDKRDTE